MIMFQFPETSEFFLASFPHPLWLTYQTSASLSALPFAFLRRSGWNIPRQFWTVNERNLIKCKWVSNVLRCAYRRAHSTQNFKGLVGLLTSEHLISIRRINIWLSSSFGTSRFSVSVPKTLTNLAKCSKCRVISVARIMSMITDLADLYSSRSRFLKMLIFSSDSVSRNVVAAWCDSSTQMSL